MASPTLPKLPECRLCGVSCRRSDKTFSIQRNDELREAFEEILGVQSPELASEILCDSCKRRILSVRSTLAAKSRIKSMLSRGEFVRGPSPSIECRICCQALKSTVFRLQTYKDTLEWIISAKLPAVSSASSRICYSCKTLVTKAASSKEMCKEIVRTYERNKASRQKRAASTPAHVKADRVEARSKRQRKGTSDSQVTKDLAARLFDDVKKDFRPIRLCPTAQIHPFAQKNVMSSPDSYSCTTQQPERMVWSLTLHVLSTFHVYSRYLRSQTQIQITKKHE